MASKENNTSMQRNAGTQINADLKRQTDMQRSTDMQNNADIQREKDREKRIQYTKADKKLVGNNGLKGKVVDVYDILVRSNNPVVVKLRKLGNYGITDEMIAERYANATTNMETRKSAMRTLSTVYKDLVRYINKSPNGIVIDPRTGEKNERASRIKAEKVGIEDASNYSIMQEKGEKILKEEIKNNIGKKEFSQDLKLKEDIKLDLKKFVFEHNYFISDDITKTTPYQERTEDKTNTYKREMILEEIAKLKGLLDSSAQLSTEEKLKHAPMLIYASTSMDSPLSQDEKMEVKALFEDFFSELKGEDRNSQLSNVLSMMYGKEIKPNDIMDLMDTLVDTATKEAEKYRLKAIDKVKISENALAMEAKVLLTDPRSPEYATLIGELEKFYNERPEYKEYSNIIRDENGVMTLDGQAEVSKFINVLRDSNISLVMDRYKQIDKSKLTEEDKKTYTTFFLVAADSQSDNGIAKESLELLKEMYPELKDEDKEEILKNITNIVFENDKNNIDNYQDKIAEMRETLNKVFVDEQYNKVWGENKKDSKISDKEMENLYKTNSVDLYIQVDLTKTALQNKFNDSKVDFNREDEETFNHLYKESSIESWISSKDEAIFHKYMALLVLDDKISEDKPASEANKIKAVGNILRNMKKRYPELDEKISKYTPEELQQVKEKEKAFQKSKISAKVLDFYQKNMLSSKVNYNDLDDKKQFEFLKMVILSRGMAERADTPEQKQMFLKLSNRAFELMNTKDKEFVSFDENGNAIMNEETILEEYRKHTVSKSISSNNFEELQKSVYDKYQRVYIFGKMTEYAKLKDSDFVELKSESPDEKLNEINKIKYRKNKERADELINQQKAREVDESENKGSNNWQAKTEEINEPEKQEENIADEQSLAIQNDTFFNKIRRGFNNLKSKITSYLNKDNNMFSKIKEVFNNDKKDEIISQNTKRENMPNAAQQKNSQENSWKVEGVTGKIDSTKNEKAQENKGQTKSEEQDEITM